ncbi:MAG TPA: hypothetical protein VES20_06470, partial [Bryobacteraceae bacterium]|nr:hypothetical protein [Bryobacteraceae bacterium]
MKGVRIPRKLLYLLGGVAGLLLAAVIAALLVLPSAWFREKVRARIVYEVERASGGRVEVGSFQFDWTSMVAEISPFVLHGTEGPGQAPLFAADSVRVGITVVSMLRRDIDIASVEINRPRVNLIIDRSGITNLPRPKLQRATARDPIETLLRLAIGEMRLRNGELQYGDTRIALDLHGRELNAKLAYNLNGPAYQGDISMRQVTAATGPTLPMTFDFSGRVALYRNRIQIVAGHVGMRETALDFSGSVEGFQAPQMAFELSGVADLAEIGKPLRIPLEHTGRAAFKGRLLYERVSGLRIDGRLTGQHLAFRRGVVRLENISTAADVNFTRDRVQLRDLTVHALDGVFRGLASIDNLKTFQLNGRLTGVAVRSLARMTGNERFGFGGTLNGPVEAKGAFQTFRELLARGQFQVLATQGGVPVRGRLEASWN